MSVSRTPRRKRGQASRSSTPRSAQSSKQSAESFAVRTGRDAGVELADAASDLFLRAYSVRPSNGVLSPANKRWSDAWDTLQEALGVTATDPTVRGALSELDGALGDYLVDHEDRAWHAAWTVAMSLRQGAGDSRAPKKASR